MTRKQIKALWSLVWRLLLAGSITFGLMSLLIRILGQNELGWLLMGLAWLLAYLGEFKDVASSQEGNFSVSWRKRIQHYNRHMNNARFWLRLAEWSVAALAGYVITQL